MVNSTQENINCSSFNNPTKASDANGNYRFLGWFADSTYNEAFDFTTPIKETTTVYAKWLSYVDEPVLYDVSYKTSADSADALSIGSFVEGEQIVLPSVPDDAVNHKVFVGFTLEGDTSETPVVYSAGDVFTVVSIEKNINKSIVKQNIIIYNDLDRIDFDTFINWNEQEKLLKVGFDVDVKAQKFTRDIAYATIESSNYRHNPYDKAKFEVSAHNFIDMSEDNYGVSILNDCKYGYEVDKQRMIITLLKAPMNPDPKSDRGDHYFTYSIYPHAGNWKNAETLVRGLEINNPAVAVEINGAAKGDDAKSFISVDGKNVTLEAVKKCEDEEAYIVRFVEKAGSRTKVSAKLFAEIESVTECDLLERNDVAVDIAEGDSLNFEINPFEIKCYKIKMK